MLEQNSTPSSQTHAPHATHATSQTIGFATFDLNGSTAQPASMQSIRTNAPMTIASTPAVTSGPTHATTRLAELTSRAESLLAHLEARLNEEREASERAARTTADIDERLRLGVRMLQAFDVQVQRGEHAASRAQDATRVADEALRASAAATETSIHALADRLAREKLEWLERELSWRFDRVKEVEERIETAANGKLAWLDGELQARLQSVGESLARSAEFTAQAQGLAERIDCARSSTQEQLDRSTARAEHATAALAGLTAQSERNIETLVARTSDASALREVLSTLTHELAASREVVQGDMRRMRDDLGWLVEKGERITAELVEHAAHATQLSEALRVRTAATVPVAHELALWTEVLTGDNRERIRPISQAIASSVRDELSADMRSFSSALRQLATRADGAFAAIQVDPSLVTTDSRDLARSFANEVSRLPTIASNTPQIETNPDVLSGRTSEPEPSTLQS